MNGPLRVQPDDLAFATERVRLRPMVEHDEALYCRIYGDAEIVRHAGAPLPLERARRSFVAALRQTRAPSPTAIFAVLAARDEGEDFGICGLRAIDLPRRRAEVGILLSASARGRGIGTDALCGLSQRAFETSPLDELYLEFSPQNAPMARLARRAGFATALAGDGVCRGIRRRAAG